MYRWIQISSSESKKLDEAGTVLVNSGYTYVNNNGNKMVEYHINCCNEFQERMDEKKIGGNVSVRMDKNEKPLIIMGHNECIFKQYLLTNKSWNEPNGELSLVPNNEGQGVMTSAL